jgi:microcystin-dependent protein
MADCFSSRTVENFLRGDAMPDLRISQLTPILNSALTASAVFPLVSDPSGSPQTRNINLAQLDERWKDPTTTLAALVQQLQQQITGLVGIPSGTPLPFAGPSENIPEGYLYCNGAAVSRETYPNLFSAIGIAHGEGNGTTTFNLPDYRGRFLRGMDDGTARDPNAATRTAAATGGNTGDNVGSLQADEFGEHTHVQNSHTHTQDAHTHTQNAHTHTQDAHTHTQNSHNHTQDAHSHAALGNTDGTPTEVALQCAALNTAGSYAGIIANTTGTNQAATATNQNATATNQNATAVNQNATATNQATTAVNQNAGGAESRPKNANVVYMIKT